MAQGETFALLGVNGAGKTTTISMLCGLTKPTSGNAYLLGESVLTDAKRIKPQINLSPQETAVAPNLSVTENLRLIAGIYGQSAQQAKASTQQALDEFGLNAVASQKAHTLSGGMQRRLSIAMGLITNPKILFLDEPTVGLDIFARRELWNVIKGLKGRVTILLTTHYLEEVEALAEYADIPVINGLTDFCHPCQVLADLMTIRERRGALEGQTLCFIGDGCSMANSLIVGCLLAGMKVRCVCPQGYRPAADVLMFAHEYGAKFQLLTDPAEGVKDADVVVTAAWNTAPGTPESERRLRDFAGFQVTSPLMSKARSDALLLHCLPAHRGED